MRIRSKNEQGLALEKRRNVMGLETDTRERTTTYDRILVKCSDINN
jgi:hypothetical protein